MTAWGHGGADALDRGLVFNIQRYSIQDGPGIRTTVFLKGCPLRCSWCHNPESISPRREILVIDSRCMGCLQCRGACRYGMVFETQASEAPESVHCDLCGRCVDACPTGARQLVGKSMTVKEVMAEVLKDRQFYEDSGGGVTFSGGEPLLQFSFLKDLLMACREEGISTAVDTCGMAPNKEILEICGLTDLFLFDLKLMDKQKHRFYTGASNTRILENLSALGQVHQRIWIRVPVIPGINSDSTDMSAIADFVRSIPGVKQVNLLPYHRAGVRKQQQVGRGEFRSQVAPPSPEEMNTVLSVFRRTGLLTLAGG